MHSIVIRHADRTRSVYRMEENTVSLETEQGEQISLDACAAVNLALAILVDFAHTPYLAGQADIIDHLFDQIVSQQSVGQQQAA
ncbi:MAG: hypothetical protein HC924_04265 [Synechococcaceae cyanobacterium SM2_3_2]|nr:hypothetical protein [Synechococcaceae cyanobacterium SM2_3_2]